MTNLTPQQNLVVVKGFGNMNEATEYMQKITGTPEVTNEIPGLSAEPFIISAENFEALLKDKSVSRYLQFFKENQR